MARTPSKVLTPADKKADAAALKANIATAKTALKDAAAAVKAHEKAGKDLVKAHAVAQKAHDKLVPAKAA